MAKINFKGKGNFGPQLQRADNLSGQRRYGSRNLRLAWQLGSRANTGGGARLERLQSLPQQCTPARKATPPKCFMTFQNSANLGRWFHRVCFGFGFFNDYKGTLRPKPFKSQFIRVW